MVLAETEPTETTATTVLLSNVQLGDTKEKDSPKQQKTALRITEHDDYLIVYPDTIEMQRLIEKACNQTKRLFKRGITRISPDNWKTSLNTLANSESKKVQKEVRETCKTTSDTSVLSIQMCVTYTITSHTNKDGKQEGYKINFYVSHIEENEPSITQHLNPEDPMFREIAGLDPKQHKNCKCSITRDLTSLETKCATQYFKKICIATMMHLTMTAS